MAPAEMNNDQGKRIDERPNYFAGQYLLEDDFRLEQEYHIDRQRRHNHLLHVSGIATGLEVERGEGLKVKVREGTAIDSQGRQIVLLADGDVQNVDLSEVYKPQEITNGDYILSIEYHEELTPKHGTDNSSNRWQEKPVFKLISPSTSDNVISLVKLTIKGKQVENLDPSVRQYSGIYLPAKDEKGVTLRSSHGDDKPNLAVLTGSLSISGMLAVTGESNLTGNVNANGSLTVKGDTTIEQELKVKSLLLGGSKNGVRLQSHGEENPNLAVLDGSLSISGNIEVIGESTFTRIVKAKGGFNVTTNGQEVAVAKFEQKGTGGGVVIKGIRGNQYALNVCKNQTDYPTMAVENTGQGTTLKAEQHGEGLAAEFFGRVRISKELTVSSIDLTHLTTTRQYKKKQLTTCERAEDYGLCFMIGDISVSEITKWRPEVKRAVFNIYNFNTKSIDYIEVTEKENHDKDGWLKVWVMRYMHDEEKNKILGWAMRWEYKADCYKSKGRVREGEDGGKERCEVMELDVKWHII